MRWTTRVNAYALGLIDRYPPFTLSPSLTARPRRPPAAWPAHLAGQRRPAAPAASGAASQPPGASRRPPPEPSRRPGP